MSVVIMMIMMMAVVTMIMMMAVVTMMPLRVVLVFTIVGFYSAVHASFTMIALACKTLMPASMPAAVPAAVPASMPAAVQINSISCNFLRCVNA